MSMSEQVSSIITARQESVKISSSSRNKYFDGLKGIAIFCVVWGHLLQTGNNDILDVFQNKTFQVIYSFHMPLFMCISGFFFYKSFKSKTSIKGLVNRIFQLLAPIIVWNTLLYLRQLVYEYFSTKSLKFSITDWFTFMDGLWFLWALIISISIVGMIRLFTPKNESILLITVLIIIFLCAGWLSKTSVFMYPFFVSGYLFSKFDDKFKPLIFKYKQLFVISYIVMLIFFNEKHFIYTTGIDIFSSKMGLVEQLLIDTFRWGIGALGCVSIALILKHIYNNFISNSIICFFINIGMKSLQIYLLQSILLEGIFSKMISKVTFILGFNPLLPKTFYYEIFTLILAFVYCAIILKLVYILDRNKKISRILFGK
ncbi:acyltransferase family protein [Priestia aryabhattai]